MAKSWPMLRRCLLRQWHGYPRDVQAWIEEDWTEGRVPVAAGPGCHLTPLWTVQTPGGEHFHLMSFKDDIYPHVAVYSLK